MCACRCWEILGSCGYSNSREGHRRRAHGDIIICDVVATGASPGLMGGGEGTDTKAERARSTHSHRLALIHRLKIRLKV